MDQGLDGQALRRHNLALLLRLITGPAPTSRANLAARTGLTRATVSTLTAELIDAGLVAETGTSTARPADRPGRPATWLATDPLGPAGIGLQVQSDHVAGYLADLAGRPVARELRRMDTHGDPHRVLRACRPVLRRLLDTATSAGRYVAGVTLAAPAEFAADADGTPTARRSVALGWGPADLAGQLRTELAALGVHGIEVGAANDVALAAAAETRKGPDPVLYLGGESTIGAALTGRSPADIAHLPVHPRGPACPCGGRGCLDRYAGPHALGTTGPVDRLLGNEITTAPDTATVTAAADALASTVRPVLAVAAPTAVLLGGYLRALPVAALRERLPDTPVRTAKLGADAAIRGAAAHALAHILDAPAAWLAQLD